MRLAYVCADRGVPVFGQKGCSVHVQEVIRALLRRGVRVELFATQLGGDPLLAWGQSARTRCPVHRRATGRSASRRRWRPMIIYAQRWSAQALLM
jgi:hypothetical protein